MNEDKILVLTHNSGLQLRIVRILSKAGYSVTSVSTIEEAIELVREQPCDLLIISPEEPKLLNMLFARFPPEMSILTIASEDTISQAALCSGTGLHSFLVEPFSAKTLRISVAQIIDSTRLVKERINSEILADLEQAIHGLATKARISQALKLIVEAGAANLGADYIALSVKDETTGEFVVRAERGEFKQVWQRLIPQVIEMSKPLLLDEASSRHIPLSRLMAEAGASSLVHIPLLIKRRVSGAIDLIRVNGNGPLTPGDLNFASILGGWSSNIIERDRLSSALQKEHQRVENLLEEITLSQENEQRRIAIDIHDGVAQWLVAASYDIRTCRALLSESRLADLEVELARLGETLKKSTRELRRVITNMRPSLMVENGLVDALNQRLRLLEEEDGFRCHFEVERELPELTFAQATTTYWIFQEALNNIKKHSKASEVRLFIKFHDNTVTVEVRDNGQGFDRTQVMDKAITLEHMGLLGMMERAELLGGSLEIHSLPDKGTLISLSFLTSPQVVTLAGEKR